MRRKEPAVASVHLLKTALELAADEAPAESSLPRPQVELHEATALRLSYRGLLRIENLQTMRSLRKLQLDNNSISIITGLETLLGLEWLDLSFNAIERIEGLETLSRLTDLSLYNNKITSVGGLSGCTALQCLSLGNNAIEPLLETVLYMRTLPALEVLTLSGNPLCKPTQDGGRDSYRPYCHAFLPKVKYLDYELVTDEERRTAREGGVPAEKLAEVEEAAAIESKAAAKAAERATQLFDLTAANLEVVRTIYDDLFGEEDAGALCGGAGVWAGGGKEFQGGFTRPRPSSDWAKVKHLPDMPRMLLSLRDALAPISAELQNSGMEKNAKIKVGTTLTVSPCPHPQPHP